MVELLSRCNLIFVAYPSNSISRYNGVLLHYSDATFAFFTLRLLEYKNKYSSGNASNVADTNVSNDPGHKRKQM